jgi:hypothetical protein
MENPANNDAPKESASYQHTNVSGGFNQHTPPYWRLMIPALMARYVSRWSNAVFNHEQKKLFGLKGSKIFDVSVGLWSMAVTGYFAVQTGNDMKNVFAEAVAYETDKKPSEIGFLDLGKSDNKAVIKARTNFMFYNTVRTIINSSFFASLLPNTRLAKFNDVDSVDLGVGLNGAYLVSEVLVRDRTFFEQTQAFIDTKINPANALGEEIKSVDLVQLFQRNAVDNDKANAFKNRMDTPEWKRGQQVFKRMAELMNQTYHHTQNREEANFALPKFLYLIGHNLIQPTRVEQTLAYIEVANRYGMSALKKLVYEVQHGTSLEAALQPYPLEAAKAEPAPQRTFSGPAPAASFVEKTAKPAESEAIFRA